jgi:hypothetical protein
VVHKPHPLLGSDAVDVQKPGESTQQADPHEPARNAPPHEASRRPLPTEHPTLPIAAAPPICCQKSLFAGSALRTVRRDAVRDGKLAACIEAAIVV